MGSKDICASLDGVERRFLPTPIELRAAENSVGMIEGYAAKFNTTSINFGRWVERIAPGAFAPVMGDDVRCLRNHNDEAILGRTTAGTLRLSVDAVGLRYECDLPDTQFGRDTAASIKRGDITGCSFQFTVPPDGDDWDFSGAVAVRTVTRFGHLYDVGPVTFPAYESTEVDMRSFKKARKLRKAAKAEAESERVRVLLMRAKARLKLAEAFNLGGS